MNHLQFMNDTLLLGGASTVIVERFKCVLDHFINTSGGKVNNGKSQLYGLSTIPRLLHAISIILKFPCLESWATLKYHGMSIFCSNLSVKFWQSIDSRALTMFFFSFRG
jgi:hypothetical protein